MQRAVVAGALGLAVLTGFAQMSARAEDGEEKSIWDFNLMDEITKGLGLQGSDPDAYRERSPLVVPPSRNLPPPQAKASESVPAAWPVDPDAKKRKEIAKAKLYTQANKSTQASMDNAFSNGAPISPGELNPPGTTGSIGGGSRQPDDPNFQNGTPMLPSQLGFLGNWYNKVIPNDNPELGTFTSEPPRANLTQPPSGYQTPSATAPYGLINKKERYKQCDLDIASGQCK
jgi:hypothetical protein